MNDNAEGVGAGLLAIQIAIANGYFLKSQPPIDYGILSSCHVCFPFSFFSPSRSA